MTTPVLLSCNSFGIELTLSCILIFMVTLPLHKKYHKVNKCGLKITTDAAFPTRHYNDFRCTTKRASS